MIEHNGHRYYRLREVAAILGKSTRAVTDDVRTGRLACCLVGNVRHVRDDDLDLFIGGRREVPPVDVATDYQQRRHAERGMEELRRRGYAV